MSQNTCQHMESSTTEVISTIEVAKKLSQAEHTRTQSQISELQETLRVLSKQMKARDTELQELLLAF
jgi:flagellar motility protein MotE (MotC chaperone)